MLMAGKPAGENTLERPGRKQGDNMKTDVQEEEWEGVHLNNITEGTRNWQGF